MIHLICALKCEAKPLIQHYRLRHLDNAESFVIYLNNETNISLTITGPGKINAATGVSYVHSLWNSRRCDGWLNIGIAGHQSMSAGQAVLAHSIKDISNDEVWYPQIVFEPPCKTAEFVTLKGPSTDYAEKVFDMEAAGFYAAASRFSTCEIIHSLKVISDNEDHPTENISESFIRELITDQIGTIDQLVNELHVLSSELEAIQKTPEHYQQCIERWHFTQYERGSLNNLLRRWETLCPESSPMDHLKVIRNSKEVLAFLEQQLDKMPIILTTG